MTEIKTDDVPKAKSESTLKEVTDEEFGKYVKAKDLGILSVTAKNLIAGVIVNPSLQEKDREQAISELVQSDKRRRRTYLGGDSERVTDPLDHYLDEPARRVLNADDMDIARRIVQDPSVKPLERREKIKRLVDAARKLDHGKSRKRSRSRSRSSSSESSSSGSDDDRDDRSSKRKRNKRKGHRRHRRDNYQQAPPQPPPWGAYPPPPMPYAYPPSYGAPMPMFYGQPTYLGGAREKIVNSVFCPCLTIRDVLVLILQLIVVILSLGVTFILVYFLWHGGKWIWK